MAILHQNKITLEDLSSDQRDKMLLQLLAEKADLSSNTVPSPVSVAGKAILQHVTEGLLIDFDDGRIDEAIWQMTHATDAGFEEILWNVVADHSFEFSEDIEVEFTRDILGGLAAIVSELEVAAGNEVEAQLLEDVSLTLCSYKDKAAFTEMVANIGFILPELIEHAISFQINTNEMRNVVTKLIHDFLMGGVIPDVARTICDTEVCQEPFPASALDMDAADGALSGFDQTGGADHG